MSSTSSTSRVPSSLLEPKLYRNVHELWFKGVATDKAVNDFPQDVMTRWYMQSDSLDKECRDNYHHVLEDVISSGVTASEIDAAITDPQERHSLVLLFDQIGRNIYRNESAKKVYTNLDPICQDLILKWTASPVNLHLNPAWKDVPHVRSWFTMPLMHSESLKAHDHCTTLQKEWLSDIQKAGLDPKFCEYQIDFEGKHRGVLEKFGRYPSRNDCLGRESTEEEKDLLKNGPGW